MTYALRGAGLPMLSEDCVPPSVCGVADLADFAYQEHGFAELIARVDRFHAGSDPHGEDPAHVHDTGIACQLAFRCAEGLALQDLALDRCQLYRVRAGVAQDRVAQDRVAQDRGGQDRVGRRGTLRVLALVGPGALMVNTPIDFLTRYLDVRLDLLYVLPDRPLPPVVPEHDVAFFALGEADPPMLARLRALFAAWPRPAQNDPGFLPMLARDTLARSLAGVDGLCSPAAVAVSRAELEAHLRQGLGWRQGRPVVGFDGARGLYPCLVRPVDSHAGLSLALARTPAELAEYLRFSFKDAFFVTAFEDYAGPDGLYRKSRVAFVDGAPFLCHHATSRNWMVHYLNAGMTGSAARRAAVASAMAGFDHGFARRHAGAFAALHERLGFDYYQIDCAETRDGRLLLFEADSAAIVHLMDPPALFPYKPPQMRRVFAAFDAMLRRSASSGDGA